MAIQGTVPVGGSFAPTDGADSFGTHNDKWGVGGYRIVKTIADRDAIPVNESELLNLDDNLASGRRKLGMMVYVSDENKFYVLTIAQVTWDEYTESEKVTALANNANFVEFSGGGVIPTLQQVLDEDNTATDTDILLNGTSKIQFENSSKVQKGTTDSGIGGNGGVALKCSIEYELKWEAGRLYIMQQDGIEIREVRYTLTVTPTVDDDIDKGFVVGSRWILDNNETWICTDNTDGAAVWIIEEISGGIKYGTTTYDTIDTYTATVNGTVTSYQEGDSYLIKFDANNIGNTKININGLEDKRIYKDGSSTFLEADDIIADKIYLIAYDGTDFQLVTLGGGGSSTGAAGGDLSGTYPDPTVAKIQGSSVSTTAPTSGKILQYNGTEWAPASIPLGGSGGGGVVYYFNYQNVTSTSPTTGLPTTPVSPSQLGITYNTIINSITSADLTQGVYNLVCGFVTIVGTPGVTTIPAGLWDFNIWADIVGGTGSGNQTQFQIRVYKYTSSTGTYTSLATSDDIFIYDPTVLTQYIGNVTMPQTTILGTDRIYIEFWAQKNVNQLRQISFHFGSTTPSHVHTTLPSVAGTGFVKVIDGVYQSPASDTISVSNLTGTLPAIKGGTGFVSYTIGDLLYADTTTSLAKLNTVAAGSVLISGTTPSWSNSPEVRAILFDNATNANTITLNTGETAANYTLTLPTAAPSANQYLQFSAAGVASWVNGTVTGVTTVGTFSASAQTNGATISGSTITFGPASATVPGMVSTGTQIWAGAKTFTGATTFNLAGATGTAITFSGNGSRTNPAIVFTGANPRWMSFGSGVAGAAPSLVNRSDGTKIVLAQTFSAGVFADFAFGMTNNSMWLGIANNTNSYFFEWYGGSTVIMTLAGDGNLTLVGNLTIPDAKNIVLATTTGTKIGTTTTQKLSFWNKTPIVQPTTGITGATFVQVNTTTAVSTASTFGGYTLQQIAAALINTGILA